MMAVILELVKVFRDCLPLPLNFLIVPVIIIITSHNRASRDCGSTVNTTIYPKGYAQSKCVSYIVTMRAGDG